MLNDYGQKENGRWAKQQGYHELWVIRRGVDALKDLLLLRDWGVQALTAAAQNRGDLWKEVEFLTTRIGYC